MVVCKRCGRKLKLLEGLTGYCRDCCAEGKKELEKQKKFMKHISDKLSIACMKDEQVEEGFDYKIKKYKAFSVDFKLKIGEYCVKCPYCSYYVNVIITVDDNPYKGISITTTEKYKSKKFHSGYGHILYYGKVPIKYPDYNY